MSYILSPVAAARYGEINFAPSPPAFGIPKVDSLFFEEFEEASIDVLVLSRTLIVRMSPTFLAFGSLNRLVNIWFAFVLNSEPVTAVAGGGGTGNTGWTGASGWFLSLD